MRTKVFAIMTCLAMAPAASPTWPAEKHYIPLVRGAGGSSKFDLQWIKLDQNGHLLKGPRLIVDSVGQIYSCAIVQEGNKILYTDNPTGGSDYQIFAVGVNPKTGNIVNGPTPITTDPGYFYYGVGFSMDGRKFVYGRDPNGLPMQDIFLKKFKKNGSVGPATIPIAVDVAGEYYPALSEDGRRVYYIAQIGLDWSIFLQKLNANGTPAGARITALAIPGANLWYPRVDAEDKWMSYWNEDDGSMYVTRLSPTGVATGTPVKVASHASPSTGAGAVGGLTSDARLIVYSLFDYSGLGSYSLMSQKLDSNGVPVGAPIVLIPESTTFVFPWVW